MGVVLPDGAAAELVAVVDRLLVQPQNLTAIDNVPDAVGRHLADALAGAAQPEIASATRIVDVGSGGGFPGLALAAALPETEVTLVESEKRKVEWLVSVSARFPNVRVVRARSEDLARRSPAAWDAATARALAPPPSAIELCAPLVAVGGHVVLWSGPRDPEMESRAARVGAQVGLAPAEVRPVAPFPGSQRHLHVLRKSEPTPRRFPRRPGRATSRPLA
jgi:16S rRNA (guanine527-N7)-methyltransferase